MSAVMNTGSIRQAEDRYAVRHWGEGYFHINAQGRVCVRADSGSEKVGVALSEILQALERRGASCPVLLRFPQILGDRVRQLRAAFAQASRRLEYHGGYLPVYPIKVNQQRAVVEGILAGQGDRVGLEAGSKPELMAVMALAPQGGTLVCNGYKDRAYVRLALMAQRLGHRVFIVVEKFSELALILEESRNLEVQPLLGLRLRLASMANGHWQNSGGEGAKFGLPSGDLLRAVETLEAAGLLHRLALAHFHMGSQISNVRDIHRGMHEAVRYMAELVRLGAVISVVDVGGGLGVDYEGTRSRGYFSVNYDIQDYALAVVRTLREGCEAQGLPHPAIFTEAGRAMTAHHAVLVTNVVDMEPGFPKEAVSEPGLEAPYVLQDLWQTLRRRDACPTERFHEALHWLNESRDMFVHGLIDLRQRAVAEGLFAAVCRSVLPELQADRAAHREVLEAIRGQFADKLFANLSVFQSLPDIWGIDQIFPILPVSGHGQAVSEAFAKIVDLTCDSDGKVERYVTGKGPVSVLPIPPDRTPESFPPLGFFLVGAYQEILGDIHNLFGDTDACCVRLEEGGGFTLEAVQSGETTDRLLASVGYAASELIEAFEDKALRVGASANELLAEYRDALGNGVYLKT